MKEHTDRISTKESQLCFDWNCPVCGFECHCDTYYQMSLKCVCGSIFEIYGHVKLTKTDEPVGAVYDLLGWEAP